MKCLKTGLCFRVGGKVYSCDMHGDFDFKIVILKDFAPEPFEYAGKSHVTWDEDNDALTPSEEFTQFMKEVNPIHTGWEKWEWIIDDIYHRFSCRTRHPRNC